MLLLIGKKMELTCKKNSSICFLFYIKILILRGNGLNLFSL